MGVLRSLVHAAARAVLSLAAFAAAAADYPAPKEGTCVAKGFRFHTGEVMPELRLHYTTIGEPDRRAGAGAARHGGLRRRHADARPSPASCSAPASRWTRALLHHPAGRDRPRQIEQAVGRPARRSSRSTTTTTWSTAQYRLLTEGLGIDARAPGDRQLDGRHADLDVGREVSGLHGRAVPMASQPTEMAEPQLDDAPAASSSRSATIPSG